MRPGNMGPRGMKGNKNIGEKPKNFKATIKRIFSFLGKYKLNVVLVLCCAILSTLFSVITPKLLGNVTNKIFEGVSTGTSIDFDYIINIIFILIILYVCSSLFTYIQQFTMSGISQRIVYDMRNMVYEKLNKLPIKYFDNNTHGELLSRVTNDIDNISATFQQTMTQLITSLITIIGIVIMMLSISPLLTLITVIVLPIGMLIVSPFIKKSQNLFKKQQELVGNINSHVEEMYTGHEIITSFNRQEESIKAFNEINDNLYDTAWRAQFISGIMMPAMTFINNIGYILVAVVGGIMVTKGRINVGDIQAFIQYTKQFSQPIGQLANIANIIQSTVASAERVFELLDEEVKISDENNTQTIKEPKGKVEFKNVDFGYSEDNILIKDMNLRVSPGNTVAIVGPTGAGKTTLINLLLRFYELNSGSILIDDVNIADMKRNELRDLFGMVLQDTWLFNGTIKENIAYGNENATDEDIINVCKASNAHHFIKTLPKGYDTVINEEGSNISQGQKQLLTIARAMLKNPKILILDEATSSVDTRTEVNIQKAMNKMMIGRTSFIIAHRLSTIKEADVILVMKDGNIIESGNHKELLKQDGFYADLYNSQFK